MREFNRGFLVAYIDFRKAFDSMCRDVLWRILELRGISSRPVHMISSLYSGTESAVKRAGDVPSLTSSLCCMEWIMESVTGDTECGVSYDEDLVIKQDSVIWWYLGHYH